MNRFLIAMALVLGFLSCSSGDDEDYDDQATFLEVGTEAHDFTFTTDAYPDGVSLSSFRGKYVMIEFWRASCPDCQKVTYRVKELYQSYASENVVFMGVSFDKDKSVWSNYVAAQGMSWLQYYEGNLDSSESLKQRYKISWVPTFYLIDTEGKVLYATTNVNKMEVKLKEVAESFD